MKISIPFILLFLSKRCTSDLASDLEDLLSATIGGPDFVDFYNIKLPPVLKKLYKDNETQTTSEDAKTSEEVKIYNVTLNGKNVSSEMGEIIKLTKSDDLAFRFNDYFPQEPEDPYQHYNEQEPIYYCKAIKFLEMQTNSRAVLDTAPIIQLGKLCVYNSECPECSMGYSQKCMANRCQCLYRKKFIAKEEHIKFGNSLECAYFMTTNPRLAYYDYGLERCMYEDIKHTSAIECDNHEKAISIVDGVQYCLNAISMFDMICTENKMCQDAFKTFEVIGLCINGRCHGQSIIDFERELKLRDCNPNVTTHCQEKDYHYVPSTHKRNNKCVEYCYTKYHVSGVAASYSETCLCFKDKSRALNSVYKPNNNV